VNETDAAVQSRLCLITFPAKTKANVEDSTWAWNQWWLARELLSALMPDFCTYLIDVDGKKKLDAEAMRDCSTFLRQAGSVLTNHDRSSDCWANPFYFMLVITKTFQVYF